MLARAKTKGSDPLRATQFMRRNGQSIAAEAAKVASYSTRCLNRVADHGAAGRMHKRRRRRDRLDHARLIVRSLQCEQDTAPGMAGKRCLEHGKIKTPVRRERKDFGRFTLKPMAGNDAGMLASGDQQNLKGADAANLEIWREHQIQRFGRARSKADLFRLSPYESSKLLAHGLDSCPRRPALCVDRGRVAARRERREHGLARRGPQRRRCIMVEIDPHHSSLPTCF